MYQQYVREHPNAETRLAYTQLNHVIDNHTRTDEEQLDLIYANFLRINIYFRDVLIINVDEKALYDIGTLFSNIGGTIGLWAGLSVITLIEVGFLLGRLCKLGVQKCRQKYRERKDRNGTMPLS